ncbi:hypothetical protein GCM10010266_14270 [Streptomyces griseomycini]|nr:hypothetical protein GCM10010266_14270 [Streptomyces griseomycini]GGR33515.1 hypothetical protein GCM10015536_43820 [Streptomyces griseomycini]
MKTGAARPGREGRSGGRGFAAGPSAGVFMTFAPSLPTSVPAASTGVGDPDAGVAAAGRGAGRVPSREPPAGNTSLSPAARAMTMNMTILWVAGGFPDACVPGRPTSQ